MSASEDSPSQARGELEKESESEQDTLAFTSAPSRPIRYCVRKAHARRLRLGIRGRVATQLCMPPNSLKPRKAEINELIDRLNVV